jgi:peptidoglycan/xylan/chitin deacetylase (PgdA/CDA1 family)
MTTGLVPRVQRAIRVAAGLSPWPAGGLVLLYHRITALDSDPQRLAVTPRNFAGHLEVLCRRGIPMPLDALATGAREAALPAHAFSVTFDDGYADVLEEAAPLLRASGVPATVFVSTGSTEEGREFWWDELEHLLLGAGPLPRRLQLPIGDGSAEWDLGDAATLGDADVARHRTWNVETGTTPTPRHALYIDLCARLRGLTGASRERTIAALAAIANQAREARPSHRRLSREGITALAAIEGITIGSHTDSHASQSQLAPADRRADVRRATAQLETLLGRPVTAFAYPFGGAGDVPEDDGEWLAQEGVTIACTTEPGSVRRDTPARRVPRLTVRDWSPAEFESRWLAWTGTT